MSMSQTIKVGIFAFFGLLILAYFILRIEEIELFGPEGRVVDAVFDSVAGLDDKAAVRIAGVRIGQVDGIELDQGRARVHLHLEEPMPLTEGSRARIASLGLLGDRYIELIPGPPGAEPLPDGAVLPGETPVTFDQAMEQLSELGGSVGEVTGRVSGQLAPQGDLSLLIENLRATTVEIRRLVEANREEVSATLGNMARASDTLARELPRLTAQMEGVMTRIADILDENRGDVRSSLGNVEEITSRMRTSVDNLNTISSRLARGEGTLGKLLTSEEAHDELVSTLDTIETGVGNLSETLGAINRLELDLGLESYYLDDAADSHSTFRLDIDPKQGNRVYRIGLVDSPAGDEEVTTERITITEGDGTVTTRTIETVRTDDDPTLTALFGFRGERGATLWGGLIEDSFGIEVDYPLYDRRLWLSVEAFDFDRQNDLDPHLRLTGEWRFHEHFYLLGGYDDPLVSDRDSLFLGGGVRWSDENLKALFGAMPRF